MANPVHEFFAATLTSIYHVYRDEDGIVHVKKIGLRPKKESIFRVGCQLEVGDFLAITPKGIIPYNDPLPIEERLPDRRVLLEHVHSKYWKQGTSRIIALFLTRQEAQLCLTHENDNLENPEWLDNTKETIRALRGDPVIRLSGFPDLAFPPYVFE